jgi:carbamoyltransferase
MGMAPFGEPKYVDKVYETVQVDDDGGFELDMDLFSFHYSSEKTFNKKFEKIFGTPKDPGMHFFTQSSGYPSYFGEKPSNFEEMGRQNQYYADLAASIQVVTEAIMVKMASFAYRETGMSKLCMAGGCALNSVANRRILKETPFDEIYINPAAGDGGTAVGSALYGYHALLGKPRHFIMEHAYWGQEHSRKDTALYLKENDYLLST